MTHASVNLVSVSVNLVIAGHSVSVFVGMYSSLQAADDAITTYMNCDDADFYEVEDFTVTPLACMSVLVIDQPLSVATLDKLSEVIHERLDQQLTLEQVHSAIRTKLAA